MNHETGVLERRQLKRVMVLEYFAQFPAALVVMESCGTAQHWARELKKRGHKVKLIAPQFVRSFGKTNKNDAADA